MARKSFSKPDEVKDYSLDNQGLYNLILYNDDFNTYEFVIDTLVEVCNHNRLQAEQCTLIAHHKGKCEVKSGTITTLEPARDELRRRGLSASILN